LNIYKTSFLVLLFLTLSISVPAQTETVSTNAVEMKKLDFLVGQWSGEGWILMGRNDRRTFRQNETVQSKADGTVLVIDGLGKGKLPNQETESIIHSAFGVISFNKETKMHRWQAFRGDGTSFDSQPKITGKTIVWGFQDPRAGEIRFTIMLNEKGQWFEVGEMSRDNGKTWLKFFEMTLNKTSS
jgi:hypothetical protein